jgi:hypothetical protein
MRHDLTLEGFDYGLRPVEDPDGEFIVDIRASDPARMRFLHPTDNHPVVSFHDSCGVRREEIRKAHFKLSEKSFDAVKHILSRKEWPATRDRLAPIAQITARRFLKNS